MSDLLQNLNAFRNKVKTAPVLPTKKFSTPPPSTPSTTPAAAPKPVAKQDSTSNDDNDNYNRVHDTTSHLSTKLLLAVEYIKEHHIVTIKQLSSYLNLQNEQNNKLISLIKNLDKIKYIPSTQSLEYVSIHNIKSKQELVVFLKTQPTFKGIQVKELKDGWSDCVKSINELEAQGQILVLRTKKDNHPRLVWPNLGTKLGSIDDEFVKLWQSIKLPEPSDLPRLLNDRGLKPASVDPASIKKDTQPQQQKKRKTRKGKITNIHMAGILKDYSK